MKFELTLKRCYILPLSMSMKSKQSAAAELSGARTCVIFPGALGDFICFLPALRALAERAPLDLFAQSRFADVAPEGVAVRSLERPEINKLFASESLDDESVKSFLGAYDAVFSWLGGRSERFASRLQALTGSRARLFPFRPATPQGHQADYYLSCLNRGEVLPSQPMIALRREAILWRDDFCARHALDQRPVLAIAPGSGAREKNWPEDFFLGVAQWWHAATGGAVTLLAGPVEQERGGIEKLRRCCLVADELRLSQAAALVSRCTVYLGNDSGMSHLAAALGVRTVAIFGPSDVRQWAPRGDKVTIVRRNIACSPCSEPMMKSCLHRACLRELLSRDVIRVLAALPEVVTLTRYRAGITV